MTYYIGKRERESGFLVFFFIRLLFLRSFFIHLRHAAIDSVGWGRVGPQVSSSGHRTLSASDAKKKLSSFN